MAEVQLDPNQSFLVKFSNYIKLVFLAVLQVAFKDDTTPLEYRWNITEADRKIDIWRAWPRRVPKTADIVIEVSSGNPSIEIVGALENSGEVRDPITHVVTGAVFSGSATFDITLTVYARTTTDRERLTDIVLIYMRHLFRQKLAQLGLAYTSIRLGGEDQSEVDGIIVYTNTVVLNVYTEYTQTFPVTLLENINNLVVDVTPVLTL